MTPQIIINNIKERGLANLSYSEAEKIEEQLDRLLDYINNKETTSKPKPMTNSDLAVLAGVTERTIIKRRKPSERKGTCYPRVSKEQRIEIKKDREIKKLTYQKIADKYNISVATAHKNVNGVEK